MSNYLLKSTATTTGRPLPKLLLGLLLLLTLTLTLQACGSGDGGDDQAKPALDFVTPTPRSCTAADVDNTQPVDEDVIQLACDNSNFAFDLYSALSDGEDNLFFSPFSISQVLAMAYAGARGETERQMAETLGTASRRTGCIHPSMHWISHCILGVRMLLISLSRMRKIQISG